MNYLQEIKRLSLTVNKILIIVQGVPLAIVDDKAVVQQETVFI